MTEWKEYKLRDLFKSTKSGDWGKDSPEGNYVEEVTCLRGADIPATNLQEINKAPTRYISEKNFSERRLSVGDLMIEMSGGSPTQSTGRIAYISQNILDLYNSRLICSNFCKVLQVNSNLIDSSFTYYLWVYLYNKRLFFSYENGTNGLKNLFLDAVLDYESVTIPKDLYEQKKIALQLSEIDDKIAVNRKICRNLEAQAQALFKHWFVDFAPFKDGKFVESELGLIPEGWRVVSLAELMDYAGGSQPPASEFIDEKREGYIRFVQIRDYASDSHITYIPESKKNKICDVKDIMIARYGVSLGRICYGLKGAYNVALAKVFPTKDYYLEFLRCYLNTMEFYIGINMKGNRAVQAGFNKSDIQSFKLPFPNDESIVLSFNEICSSLFEKRLSSEQESRRLATLRDTLLPKLMSGQIKL